VTLRQTIFQAREMLLDYIEKKLDPAREELVKKAIANDLETQRALSQITKGLELAEVLSKVKVDQNFCQNLLEAESFSSLLVRYARFKNWNHAVKVSTYAISSCFVVAVIALSLPRGFFQKLKSKPVTEVVLSDIPKNQDLAANTDDPEKRDAQASLAQNLPTDTDEEEASDDASGDDHSEPMIVAQQAPKEIAPAKMAKSAAPENQDSTEDNSTEKNSEAEKRPRGFVYRGTMKIDQLDERTPIIAQKIRDLDGVKAGEVELGWRKENKGSYYHFSVPEANYEKLLEELKAFGPVRFSKDSHPRVMPTGQIRIILWVERSNP
jgi:hypothetical protein